MKKHRTDRRAVSYTLRTLLAAMATTSSLFAADYHVATTGNDTTGTGTSGNPWKTLKKACSSVPANLGHRIVLGTGNFYDTDRFDGAITAATLPRNVSLKGQGKTLTSYFGRINAPDVNNQSISDFFLDGRENQAGTNGRYQGLVIDSGNGLDVMKMRIEGFHSNGLIFGEFPGLTNSNLYECELINNSKWNDWAGFGMKTGSLTDCKVYKNTFREERGKGWTAWNTGQGRVFRNVKVYENTFWTHRDTTYGWKGQAPFNLEWVTVECFNCEIYSNSFNGVVSLVDKASPSTNKPTFSVRVYGNRWDYTNSYAIEASMGKMEIDNNYMHFGIDPDPDTGGGYGAIVNFGTSGVHNMLIHHNVMENVPRWCIFNMVGNNVEIYNNTATMGSLTSVPNHLKSETPQFIINRDANPRTGWKIRNNVLRGDSTRIANFFNTGTPADPPSAIVSNNLMQNAIKAWRTSFGTQAGVISPVVADPMFNLSGIKPDPFFAPAPGSPLINSGVAIAGITDGFAGTAPEIGAYEVPEASADPVLIASEDFESGTWSGGTGWKDSAWAVSSPAYVNVATAYGAYNGQLRNSTSAITRAVDLSGSSDVVLSLRCKTQSFETGDSVFIEFDNGSGWQTVRTITGNVNWPKYDIQLTGPMVGNNQRIRMRSGMNAGDDYAYFDSVEVKGRPVQSAREVIATEDFETGTWTGGSGPWIASSWAYSGSSSLSSVGDNSTQSVLLRSSNSSVSRSIDLSAFRQVEIEVSARNYLFEAGDEMIIEFHNGTQWVELERSAGPNWFVKYTYPVTFTGSIQQLRFRGGMTDTSDYAYFDNIVFTGIRN